MPRPITPADLWALRRVGDPAADRRGDVVVVPVERIDVEANEGRAVLHRIGLDGGAPIALTDPELSSRSPAVSPQGDRVAFLRKARAGVGEGKAQLHLLDLAGGEARRLGAFPLGCSDPRFSPDGTKIVVVAPLLREALTIEGTHALLEARAKAKVRAHVTEDRVYRYWDRWLTDGAVPHLFSIEITTGDVATGACIDLTPGSTRWFDLMDDAGQFDLSPDGREIVFAADESEPPHARMRSAIFLVATDGAGAVRCLTEGNPADDLRPRWSPCGRTILFGARRRDYYGDRVRLCLLDRTTGRIEVLTERWDRSPSEWIFRDARTIVGLVEDEGATAIFEIDLEGDRSPRIVARGGTLHGLVATGAGLLAAHHDLRRPPEIAIVRDQGSSRATRIERVSDFNGPLLAELDLATPEEIRFEGARGDSVLAYLLRPSGEAPAHGPSERGRPLVHLIHGGPYGSFGDLWHFRWNAQVFAAAGFAVTMVNFHGSSGFGEAFARSILGDWGGAPAEDILRATDAIVARGGIDPSRIAITGGSYGGYLTAWLATQTDRFRCAIAHAPVYNFAALWGSDVTQGTDAEIGLPWGDDAARAAFDRFDPSRRSRGFATPMLVIHGELDYRVPATEGLQLYGTLKAMGVEARLVYYPDENHWILKPQNSLHWYGEVLGWLRRHLQRTP
jgi:dipeptidyl aminopeptidase/acylaminoacyl peptidase